MRMFFGILGILFVCLLCIWGGIHIMATIQFNRNCEGYLKRAADANTIELSKKQLKIALDYMENKKLTSGYTSILYRTPDEDIEFWYSNIRKSFNELEKISPSATQLERSNLLNNSAITVFCLVSSVLVVVFLIVVEFLIEYK